jgi:hypothetical protein
MSEYIYKRYMVFTWDDYDNPSPFDCVVGSFDDIESAKDLFIKRKDFGKCIFDRIEGIIIYLHQT